MSTNPLRNTARIAQTKSEKGDVKGGVTLFDIDYAIMSYLEDTVLPTLDDNGKALKIPVVYGNSERWNGARRDGVYRDNKGRIQLPIMMIRRTSIGKDENMPMLNRHVSYSTVTKYSKDNRYDRFSILGKSVKPKYQLYNITMPKYVEVSYECMAWTSYTEHLNSVIEQLQYAGTYWGDRDKFKFRTDVSNFEIMNEVGENSERINRVQFTVAVKAYLLPEKTDGESPIKKTISTKRVIIATEVDVTGNGRLEGLLTTPSPYYDNKDLIDFLSLNNSKVVDGGTNNATFANIKLIQVPAQLSGVVTSGLNYNDSFYDIKLYINGVRYYQTSHFTVTSYTNNTLTLSLSPEFSVNSGDEITITGKFIDIV
jgi:hypothetical protein